MDPSQEPNRDICCSLSGFEFHTHVVQFRYSSGAVQFQFSTLLGYTEPWFEPNRTTEPLNRSCRGKVGGGRIVMLDVGRGPGANSVVGSPGEVSG